MKTVTRQMVVIALTVALIFVFAYESGGTSNQEMTANSGDAQVTVSGVLAVMWGDPPPDSDGSPRMRYVLTDEQAKMWSLVFEKGLYWPPGGPAAFSGRYVTVEGEVLPDGKTAAILVHSIKLG